MADNLLVYTDPKGKEYNVPADPTPEEAQQIKSMGLTPKESRGTTVTKDVLRSAISGGAEGTFRGPMVGGDVLKLGALGLNKVLPNLVSPETVGRFGSQPWIDAFKDSPQDRMLKKLGLDLTHDPETAAGDYTKAGTSAAASAVSMGALGGLKGLSGGVGGLTGTKLALSPIQLGINGATGLASQLGLDASRGFDRDKPGNPIVAMLAGLGTGGGLSAIKNMRTPNLNQALYNATKDVPSSEWDAAKGSLRDFENAGAKTHTLADLPQLQSNIGGLAQGLTNTTGGNLLGQKLSLQARTNNDIPSLVQSALDDVHPGNVDPREITRIMAEKGQSRLDAVAKTRTNSITANLNAAPMVDPTKLLTEANRNIRMPRLLAENSSTGTQKGLDLAETAVLGKDAIRMPMIGQVIPQTLNLRALSKNVKALENTPINDANNPAAAITRMDRSTATKAAQDTLSAASPAYGNAMSQYRDTTKNILEPLENSLVGGVKGATSFDQIMTRLRQVPPDKLQAEINSLGLSDPEVLQLAHAVGKKIDVIPNLMRASDTSKADRAIFSSLVDYVDPSLAAHATNKLNAADNLSRLSSEHAADRTLGLNLSKNPISAAVSPFGTINLRSGLRTSEKEANNLANLIGNPTQANLARLRELAKVDPRARRALELVSTLDAGATNSATQK
jgi:hypothetical protein